MSIISWLWLRVYELAKTVRSLAGAGIDLVDSKLSFYIKKRPGTFAFLVHPRSSEFHCRDVYGENDIFRPFPALRWLTYLMEPARADAWILRFARWINPIKLSRIKVRTMTGTYRGYLLTTVRTPEQLFKSKDRKAHLTDLFALACSKGVARVGLGALLPAASHYGKEMQERGIDQRPAISTGHAYTGYIIVDYLRMLVSRRNAGQPVVRVAIVGAAGSTGKSVIRALMLRGTGRFRYDLLLVDLPSKQLELMRLVNEARDSGKFAKVHGSIESADMRSCKYIVCVTNSTKATILPEHVNEGTVIIDDSQPRNTTPALKTRSIHVLDVLARVKGLDVGFDFGFQTQDKQITFTCLAETVLASITGVTTDLAVGEVTLDTMRRTIEMVKQAESMGLVGDLPFVSFGKEMAPSEINEVLDPEPETNAPAAPEL